MDYPYTKNNSQYFEIQYIFIILALFSLTMKTMHEQRKYNNMGNIIIAGKNLPLTPMTKSELKGVFADAIVKFVFYKTEFQGNPLCILVSKRNKKLTPLEYKQLADRLEKIIRLPIVFLFDSLEYYERDRFIDRGVYFVVTNKYVFLPYLLINAKQSPMKKVEKLLSTAQYLLLFHLQIKEIEGLTIQEIEKLIPYKYVTLTRAITSLEQLNLCRTEKNIYRQKVIYFDCPLDKLWEQAQPFMENPIRKIWFCDHLPETPLPICGINALSHYTSINPENFRTYAIDNDKFNSLVKKNMCIGINPIEGNIKLEIWNYPPLVKENTGIVDKLSLYLTLKEDKDPRVEKELEKMLKELWLKD